MIDEAYTPNHRIYNPMSKDIVTASLINGVSQRVAFYQGAGSKADRTYKFRNRLLRPRSASEGGTWGILPSVASFGIPWTEMVVSLADQVSGRLQTKSLILVTLKEMASTIRMVKNPFGLLKANWRHIAHTLTAKQLARAGANIWLEGQYGWKASYNDLSNFAKSAATYYDACTPIFDSSGDQEVPFHASVRIPYSPPAPTTSHAAWKTSVDKLLPAVNSAAGLYRFVAESAEAWAHVSCRKGRAVAQSFHKVKKIFEALGATPRDILPVLWEIVPYSFVVDWFINTNDLMSGLFVNESRDYLTETVSTIGYSTVVQLNYHAEWIPGGPYNAPSGYIPTSCYAPRGFNGQSAKICSVRRTRGFPVSDNYMKSKGLSLTQSLSGVSLLIQRLAR